MPARMHISLALADGPKSISAPVSFWYSQRHWMGVPGSSTLDMQRVYHPVFNEWLALGGTPAGTAHAQRDSTDREITFLTATLGGH